MNQFHILNKLAVLVVSVEIMTKLDFIRLKLGEAKDQKTVSNSLLLSFDKLLTSLTFKSHHF